MESKTYIKNLRISPKKLRFFLPAIKKMTPAQSTDYLFYINKKPAMILYKSIKSALNNAKNTLKVEVNLLQFKLLTIEEGQKLKRFKAGSRGTAKPIKRRMAHIKIILKTVDNKPATKVETKVEAIEKSKVKRPSLVKATEGKQK